MVKIKSVVKPPPWPKNNLETHKKCNYRIYSILQQPSTGFSARTALWKKISFPENSAQKKELKRLSFVDLKQYIMFQAPMLISRNCRNCIVIVGFVARKWFEMVMAF